MTTYKLVRAEDNTVWLSIQPLMSDVKEVITGLSECDMKKLSPEEKNQFDLKIIGLKAIFTFLDTLMQQQEHDEAIHRQTTDQ